MIIFLFFFSVQSIFIELHSTNDRKYLTKQQIGDQSLEFQITLDTNLLMVLDSQMVINAPAYSSDDSTTFQLISSNSELCWTFVQVSTTSECSFIYRTETNNTCEGALSLEKLMFGSLALTNIIFGRIQKESTGQLVTGLIGVGPANLKNMYGTSIIEAIISVIK